MFNSLLAKHPPIQIVVGGCAFLMGFVDIRRKKSTNLGREIKQEIMNASAPIGIFDSGIGGLTVARAVKNIMPQEQIIYFGDTAHLPYGDKSTASIQAYSVKIADVLLQSGCKLILIACNSASTAAFDLVKGFF